MFNFSLHFNNVFVEQVNARGYESSLDMLAHITLGKLTGLKENRIDTVICENFLKTNKSHLWYICSMNY